jgi:uncharacterized protein
MKFDLTDAEFDELDELLARTPEPLEPLDVLMLEGYLCGVLVQPRLLPVEAWLPPVFDLEGRSLPETVDADWLVRVRALAERRHAALNAALAEDGWFDPVIVDPERAPPASEYDVVQSEHSRALLPWVVGFHWAQERFPELGEWPDEGVSTALARLYRHLPAETDEERSVVATLEREHPLATLDDATEELVFAVADLWDITREERYRVEPIKRDAPKVGRNDPCPCGSGKKFKQCHGA